MAKIKSKKIKKGKSKNVSKKKIKRPPHSKKSRTIKSTRKTKTKNYSAKKSKKFISKPRSNKTKIKSSGRSKSVLVSHKKQRVYGTDKKVIVTKYRYTLPKKDQLDLADIRDRDAGIIYLVLKKHFSKLIKKVKPKEVFNILVEYDEGTGFTDFVSSGLTSFEDLENVLDSQLLELSELLEAEAEKYLDRKFASQMKLTQIFITTRDLK